jgi:hypothetical protein
VPKRLMKKLAIMRSYSTVGNDRTQQKRERVPALPN